ncbi:MAG: hypothetical protein LLG01_16270 [Planctomycetaceae bacterium]|nr:hypothetical protein [Planctomycetaceae bacterium]
MNDDRTPFNAPTETDAEAPFNAPPQRGHKPADVAARTNLMLVVMFLAGIAGIALLALRERPKTASADQQQTEQRVDEALSLLAGGSSLSAGDNAKDMVNAFYFQARQRQIPRSGLGCNPFVYVPAAPPAAPAAPAAAPKAPSPAKNELAKEEAQARQQIEAMVLQSVLSGSSGAVAMISNNLLTEGQSLNGWTVAKIEPRQVTLAWKHLRAVLTLRE